jgi:hypothetical protein
MKLVLNFVSELTGLSDYLVQELRQMVARINSWASQEHDTDGKHAAISVTGFTFNGTTQTTVGAAGGASALPATPSGYVVFTIGTTEYVTPFYAKS